MFDVIKHTAIAAVADALESRKLTLSQAAALAGKAPATLHNWLNDDRSSGCMTTTLLAFLQAVGLGAKLTTEPLDSPPKLSDTELELLRSVAMDRPQPQLREADPAVRTLHRLGLIFPTEYGATERGWALVGKMLEAEEEEEKRNTP